jgi:crotonobetainyl-CoA:carnitine CoA-transferase CaiB-like acyl-CoA transferase
MLPFSGIRIVAWTTAVAGPYGGMIFADLGAEVIKIERPGAINTSISHNRNKKSIAIDARKEEGKEIMRKLIKTSDIFYENMAPGTVNRFGFSYEEVAKINPQIIYISLKGYGEGPYGLRPAWDPPIECETGIVAMTGENGRMPMRIGGPTLDETTGIFCVISALAALLTREKTGKGEYIRANMFEDAISIMQHYAVLYSLYGILQGPQGSGTGAMNAFETTNGWIYVDADTDEEWDRFCSAFNVDDEKRRESKTKEQRDKDPEAVEMIIASVVSKMSRNKAVEKLSNVGIPVAPVNLTNDLIDDPQLRATQSIVAITQDPEVTQTSDPRNIVCTMLPLRSSDYHPNIKGWGGIRMPRLGEHTAEILDQLGYDEQQIAELRKNKTVWPYLEE